MIESAIPTEFVVKVHSRCDLACDHCYVYTMADQGWRNQPRAIGDAVVVAIARRIAEHVRDHDLLLVRLILHGGEPLLAGPERLASISDTVRTEVARVAGPAPDGRGRVGTVVQTNGVRLTAAALETFDRHDIKVAVSLDGTPAAHDRHRRFRDGRGSHGEVTAALALLRERPHLYAGILCTIDPRNDPVETYEALLDHRPPAVDFLLPHGNWSAPPPGRPPDRSASVYAGWLIAVFDRWFSAPRRETKVRLFQELVHLLLGGATRSSLVGTAPPGVLVIETNGAIELSDTLKSTYPGAAATGRHVFSHTFSAVTASAHVRDMERRSTECLGCPLLRVCGGGSLAHRYAAGSGFVNPSVYCGDLSRLIRHVQAEVVAGLAGMRAAP
ncbi:radical SAM protein [Actinomadura craniellae]|uniref:Radical SAM protein n=1 Tax=Actinomadura craniellae TaxID=2231787 RepID=A0A365H6M5_9ACTN|nr:FxsB family cyclophane-forming radical SAM/SPASM peptide maturase [Actinomadura craniellae]RAY14774.1 radical SAM protein [Actinomadura craniellae]